MPWILSYHHDGNGVALAGSKAQLLKDVDAGASIRIVITFYTAPAGAAPDRFLMAFEPTIVTSREHEPGRTEVFAQHAVLRYQMLSGLPTAVPPDSDMETLLPHVPVAIGCCTSGRIRLQPTLEPNAPPPTSNIRKEMKWFALK